LKLITFFFPPIILLAVNVKALPHVAGTYGINSSEHLFLKLDTNKNRKPTKDSKLGAETKIKSETTAKDTNKKDGNSLKSEVISHAEDSVVTDQENQITYLYGRARVKYEDFELDADYIRLDQKKNLLFAKGSIDPVTKAYVGRPISKQGKDKPLESDSLLFNYKTKKGKIYNPASEQDGDFLSGGVAKKLNETEVAYKNVIFSTCSLPYPDTHFGIVITKGIAEKNRIISGPAYLEIEGIPLPLVIPFGFFPKPDTRTSGVIIPTFGEDQRLGFFLRDFGYYIGLNDYVDLTTMGSIYSKGSYEVSETVHYKKRYKYDGNFTFNYGSHNYGLEGDPPQKDYKLTWSHSQDPNANPGSTLSASVNIQSSKFAQNNPASVSYNAQSLVTGSLNSSVNYSKTWAGTPFNMSLGLTQSQDLVNQTVSLNLPTLSFSMASLSPFDSKERVGEQKWYQKVTLSYSLQASNSINALPESELFNSSVLLKALQTHITHNIPVGLSLNVLKYFQLSTNVNYTEHWYLQSINKAYARGSANGRDSLVTDTINGFKRAGSYTLGTSLSTKVYSTFQFKKGNLEAIRHVMTPSLSFSFNPDFSSPGYGYYKTIISNAIVPYPYSSTKYSIFEDGFPSAGRTAGVGFNLDNNIEIKLKPKTTDTSGKDRKIPIIQGLSFSSFYNFAQDSLRLSQISFTAHTAILNQKVNLSLSGALNPYVTKLFDSVANGQITHSYRTINTYSFQNGQFPTLTSITFSMSGSLNSTTFDPVKHAVPGSNLQNITTNQAQRLAAINSDPSAYVDFNVPWNLSFNYSLNYGNGYTSTSVSNTLMLSGDFNLTSKWKIQYSTTYDLRALKLSGVPSFSIYRDLHCWDLNVQWVPFGYFKSYNVTLKVRAAILQDLKLSKRSDYTSNSNYNQY
jgi:lipopolysaccharide assembly outer membrane protein LptD (OstA)